MIEPFIEPQSAMPSDRKFGLFMGIILALFAGWSFYRQDMGVAVYAGAAAGSLYSQASFFQRFFTRSIGHGSDWAC